MSLLAVGRCLWLGIWKPDPNRPLAKGWAIAIGPPLASAFDTSSLAGMGMSIYMYFMQLFIDSGIVVSVNGRCALFLIGVMILLIAALESISCLVGL